MLIYTSTRSKNKRKPKAVREQNKAWLKKHGSNGKTYDPGFVPLSVPLFQKPIIDRQAGIKFCKPQAPQSKYSVTRSVMDPMQLQQEKPEVQEAIVAKSKRVAIHYNKGPVQYITEETDPKHFGRK